MAPDAPAGDLPTEHGVSTVDAIQQEPQAPDSQVEDVDRSEPKEASQAEPATSASPEEERSNELNHPDTSKKSEENQDTHSVIDKTDHEPIPEEASTPEVPQEREPANITPELTSAPATDPSMVSVPQEKESLPASEPVPEAEAVAEKPPSQPSEQAPATPTMQHSKLSANSLSRGGAVFVISALEAISASKEARRNKTLKEATTTALDMVRRATGTESNTAGQPMVLDPRVVFEPLRLACESKNVALLTTSLDCIAKLVSYAFFAEDHAQAHADSPLADLVVETV